MKRKELVETLKHEVFEAARDGRSITAEDFERWEKMDADVEETVEVPQSEVRTPEKAEGSEMRSFENYVRKGEERNLVSNTGSGSYLVPQEWHDEVLRVAFEKNFVAGLSRVIRTTSTNNIPVVTALGTAAIVGENTAYTATDPTIGQVILNAYKNTYSTILSEELLKDAAYDVMGELAWVFGEAFAAAEQSYYLVGTGSSQPTGVFNKTADKSDVSKTAGPTKADLITIKYGLAREYRDNAVWVMDDTTLAIIATLKEDVSTSGTTPYWWTDSRAGEPATLLGHPVYTDSAVANVGADAKVICFGNFDYYVIGERGPLELKRLDGRYEYGTQFAGAHRIDGKPMTTSAFYIAQCAS